MYEISTIFKHLKVYSLLPKSPTTVIKSSFTHPINYGDVTSRATLSCRSPIMAFSRTPSTAAIQYLDVCQNVDNPATTQQTGRLATYPMSSSLDCVPAEPRLKPKSPYAVQIEEVLDEYFIQHRPSNAFDELLFMNVDYDAVQSPTVIQEQSGPGIAEATDSKEASMYDGHSGARRPITGEGDLDEETCLIESSVEAVFDHSSDKGATMAWHDPLEASLHASHPKQCLKNVRYTDTDNARKLPAVVPNQCAYEDLRFIFFRETRDFNSYQELHESYQALVDEAEGHSYSGASKSDLENSTTFVTHSPYTPPATMFDLQYYRIPASYYHTFWHPQRIPIYLHGNVFDGISLMNWIYNWTSYTFKDDSYQMNAVRRFGETVVKIGSALSDIEHAMPAAKARLPRDLYDESGVLWADLENFINDIMSEAEDRLGASKHGGRLEVAFVRRFVHELIAGKKYHRTIEKFLKRTEAWCKEARFHPDFIMLWELWAS
ncbi:hypothetical protein VTL71DRAFT_10917 [Oculimacula yallundae]|uniref:Uncharacterized protein n=1 Tax=Oculimacula yallundae TaxID=86028 RepID=A0ABR4CWP3_9HELO